MPRPISKRIRQIFSDPKLVEELSNWTEECSDCMGLGVDSHGTNAVCPHCESENGDKLTDVAELMRYIVDRCRPFARKKQLVRKTKKKARRTA